MAQSMILFEKIMDGKVGVVRLNRPEVMNAVSMEFGEALHKLLDELVHMRDVRVVILLGEGKSFCSGADLKAYNSGVGGRKWDSTRLENQEFFSSLVVKMRRIPQPIIAVVQGSAAGGGMAFALAADVRLVCKDARFIASFGLIGLSGTELGTSFFLPRQIGQSDASLYLMTGDPITAEEAVRLGLGSLRVFETREAGFEAAREIAGKMLRLSPLGLVLTKKQLNATADGASLESAVHQEDVRQILCLNDRESLVHAQETSASVKKFSEGGKGASILNTPSDAKL